MRRNIAMVLAVAIAAMGVGLAIAAVPGPSAHDTPAVHAKAGAPATDPGDTDGIERMDGPDAWDRMGMGPAGLQVPYGRGRGPAAAMRMRAARRAELMKELDLSDVQRDRIEAIRDHQQRFMIEQQSKLKLARLDLRSMLKAETLNRSTLEAKVDEVSRLEAQARKARLDAMLDMRGVLTVEQQKQLRAKLD